MSFNVQSEVGQLRQVIVHRPGLELSRLSPRNIADLLFDDVMWAKKAKEHDAFAEALRDQGVWNGLTDDWHPTQMLADVLTMRDHTAKPLSEVSVCYLGDGRNNTANSLLATGALLGMDTRICAPAALQPAPAVQALARDLAAQSGASVTVTADLAAGGAGADFLYTDVWVSMGELARDWDQRIDLLLPYQVNAGLIALSGNPGAKFMHCLPALHTTETGIGQDIYARRHLVALEVTDEVFGSPASIVFDQAENRLHTIKALMVATIGAPA